MKGLDISIFRKLWYYGVATEKHKTISVLLVPLLSPSLSVTYNTLFFDVIVGISWISTPFINYHWYV